jgi:hypothetical protein
MIVPLAEHDLVAQGGSKGLKLVHGLSRIQGAAVRDRALP